AERAAKLEDDLAALEAEGAKADARRKVQNAADKEMQHIRERGEREVARLDEIWNTFNKLAPKQMIIDETIYEELVDRYEDYFTGGMGAEAIQTLIRNFDLDAEAEELRDVINNGKGEKKMRALKRLKVVAAFQRSGNDPAGIVLDSIPVIPPELRPMVQLDGGRFATSDLNCLYRRVINRNNRLKRMIDLGAPEIIVNNEKRSSAVLASTAGSSLASWRGRGRSTSMSAMMVDSGLLDITSTRSDSKMASSTSWVTITTVRCDASQILSNCSCSSRRVRASRAPKGSSRSMIGGSMAKARAMPTRCCMPPERRAGRRSAASESPTCSKWVLVISARSDLLKPGRAERNPKSILPRAVIHGNSA